MLKKISKLVGAHELSKFQQKQIKGGIGIDPRCESFMQCYATCEPADPTGPAEHYCERLSVGCFTCVPGLDMEY